MRTLFALSATVFAGHGSQEALPIPGAYVFTGHSVQLPPSAPKNPGSHWQLVTAMLALGEPECAGHAEHSSSPCSFLNTLSSHVRHIPDTLSSGGRVLAVKLSKV